MRSLILAAAALLTAAPAAAQAPAPPRLLIVISVDQLSADLFEEYRPHFTGGLARLASGMVLRNGYQSHAATETCPGHSTILTGMRPARTGIIANSWYDPAAPRADKAIYCAEDETVGGTTSGSYVSSPVHLRVPTLGDLLKRSSPQSLSVAVSGKDRSALMTTGNSADQRWFWRSDRFASDLRAVPVPRTIEPVNRTVSRMIANGLPPLDPPPHCVARSKSYAIPAGKPVGSGRLALEPGDARGFRANPAQDGAVLAIAAGLVHELGLGRDASPDILSIGLSATDLVGHTYGTGGQEMCLQLLAIDRELGDFLGVLDRMGLDYAVALTADHGGVDIPERLRDQRNAAAARADRLLIPENMGRQVAAELGLPGSVLIGEFAGGDAYLDPALDAGDRARALAAAVAAYRAHSQVHHVFTADELKEAPEPSGPPDRWDLKSRVRASFDPERSGDLIVILKPYVNFIVDGSRGYASAHGSPWDYDRRVPIIFWRRGMAASTREEAIETIDIMPTLAALLELRDIAPAVQGHCLAGIPGVTCDAR